jgi:Uma2 family endonuclease
MENLAYEFKENERSEMLNGRIIMMAPQFMRHKIVVDRILQIFGRFLKGKNCIPFGDGADVILSKTDRVVPDFMVVCNRDIIKRTAIHGAPDLVVEVLSRSTEKNDKGYKKELYERSGVREYWLINTLSHSVDVNALEDGKYRLVNVYSYVSEEEFSEMDDEEKEEVVNEFSPVIFPDLKVSLAEIFEDIDY